MTQEMVQAFDADVQAFARYTDPTSHDYNIDAAFLAADNCYQYAKQLSYPPVDASRDWDALKATWYGHRSWAQNAAMAAHQVRR